MDYKKPRGTPEKDIKLRCRKIGVKNGWKPKPLNVSAGIYSTPGWPDDLWLHPLKGGVWVEFKVPGGGLELSQVNMFKDLTMAGIPVFVVEKESDLHEFMNTEKYDSNKKMGGNWWRYVLDGRIR